MHAHPLSPNAKDAVPETAAMFYLGVAHVVNLGPEWREMDTYTTRLADDFGCQDEEQYG